MPKATRAKAAKEFWTGGRKGTLSALSQAQVWALTKVNEKHNLGLTLDDIAKEVWVIGPPRRHPSSTTIENWQAVFANDKEWHPGKSMEEREGQGRKRKFTDHMRLCVKKSAEALKLGKGIEPTVNLVRQRCTKATVNPDTGEYFRQEDNPRRLQTRLLRQGGSAPVGATIARLTICVVTHAGPEALRVRESRGGQGSFRPVVL